jgi:hypothetical protein
MTKINRYLKNGPAVVSRTCMMSGSAVLWKSVVLGI